jgi:hypothetical protein
VKKKPKRILGNKLNSMNMTKLPSKLIRNKEYKIVHFENKKYISFFGD